MVYSSQEQQPQRLHPGEGFLLVQQIQAESGQPEVLDAVPQMLRMWMKLVWLLKILTMSAMITSM